jgi:hypothetical protein
MRTALVAVYVTATLVAATYAVLYGDGAAGRRWRRR